MLPVLVFSVALTLAITTLLAKKIPSKNKHRDLITSALSVAIFLTTSLLLQYVFLFLEIL